MHILIGLYYNPIKFGSLDRSAGKWTNVLADDEARLYQRRGPAIGHRLRAVSLWEL